MAERELKPFDTVVKQGPYSINGYVVIPDDWPVDYFDTKYRDIDDGPVGGITFGGYMYFSNGVPVLLAEMFLDAATTKTYQLYEKFQSECVPVIGFDDNHAWPIELPGQSGADYLASELKKLQKNRALKSANNSTLGK